MEEYGAYYIIIPAPIRHCKNLSTAAKLLYGEIAFKCHIHGFCWATNKFFADVMGVTERNIQRNIKELEINKFIKTSYEIGDKGTQRKIRMIVQFGGDIYDTPEKNDVPQDEKKAIPRGEKKDTQINNTTTIPKSKKSNKNTIIPPAGEPASGSQDTGSKGAKKAKPKNTPPDGAPPPLTKTLHQPFIDVYHKWYMDRNGGVKPQILAKDAAAVKTLIGSMAGAVNGAAGLRNEFISEKDLPEHVLRGWSFLLAGWEKLTPFLQQQTDLCQISSNFNNIISILKNGTGKVKPINGSTATNAADYVNNIAALVNQRLAGER